MAKKKIAKTSKAAELKVLSKSEILARCAPIESKVVPVQGWGAGVRMKNITFDELIKMRVDMGTDGGGSNNAMMVAAVCEDLEMSDVYKLQKSNGIQFALLYAAVENFIDFKLTDEKIKN